MREIIFCWKELFALGVFHEHLSVWVCACFPFGFEGKIWDLIVSIPYQSLSFFFHEETPKRLYIWFYNEIVEILFAFIIVN